MKLNEAERDRLLVYLTAELARARRGRGLRLNAVEATALVADAVCEAARDGKRLAEAVDIARSVLNEGEVLPGVARAVPEVRVEAVFEDGTGLAVVRDPFRAADRLRERAVDAVCGPMEGGAFLAYAVSDLLAAAFLPGYRSPGETAGYHLRPVLGGLGGWRVGVVDDAVNAGTAVAACVEAVRGQGAVPVAVASLLALGDASTTIPERLGVPFYPAATLPSRTWPARQCPLCAEAIPLTPPPP